MVKNNEKGGAQKAHHKDRVIEFTKTLEWTIMAFILALVFRAFVMEAYRIPTGSMAPTLKGDHYLLRCPQCGHRYEYGFDSSGNAGSGRAGIKSLSSRCPSCGYFSTNDPIPIAKGDRILVLKCIYQFLEPKRWDVVVFKNPLDPRINYIKRLIALPGETIEIIDGDIYIDGKIQRKPPKVQEELWMPVYNNDYQPARPKQGVFNGHLWQQPFIPAASNDASPNSNRSNTTGTDSQWQVAQDNPTVFRLDSPAEQISTMVYDTSRGNDFRTTYAYNDVNRYRFMPFCSDLKVRLYANSFGRQAVIGIELSKYQTRYRASVRPDGNMIIERIENGRQAEKLTGKSIKNAFTKEPKLLSFTNIDHQLIFRFGREKLIYDLGLSEDAAGAREIELEPSVKIVGSGKLAVSHVAIFRDIHYTSSKYGNGRPDGRAVEGNSFTLRENEFFVLGDNSPNSEDGRWWAQKGIGNKGAFYRQGIVPHDYLVGKALFVYWPSGFEFPWPRNLRAYLYKNSRQNTLFRIANVLVSLNWIPNLGQMRFIYGGSNSRGKTNKVSNGV
ncbi:signal peptidase I [Planctomycetota bacterium]